MQKTYFLRADDFFEKKPHLLGRKVRLAIIQGAGVFYWSATEVETFVGVENFTQTTLADES